VRRCRAAAVLGRVTAAVRRCRPCVTAVFAALPSCCRAGILRPCYYGGAAVPALLCVRYAVLAVLAVRPVLVGGAALPTYAALACRRGDAPPRQLHRSDRRRSTTGCPAARPRLRCRP